MRLLCATALSLSLGLWVACADAKKPIADDKADRAAKLAELKKKFESENKELIAKLQKAESPVEARGVQAEMRELVIITAGKALKLTEADPKDATSFDAAAFILESAGKVGATGGDVEKAVGLIAEHHVTNPKVKDFLIPAMQMGATGEKLLKAVSEKATDKDAKATALFIRGYVIAQNVDDEEDAKKQAAMVKEATELMDAAAKLSPDTKLGSRPNSPTVGDLAKSEIEGLQALAALAVGKPAPEVESKLLDGKAAKLADYKGKVVLLDIWATWCGPCVRMIPHERELVKKLKDKPFVLVSVSADDKKETLQKFLEKEAMPWVHWWDEGPKSKVLTKYRVRAFPTLYLIDHTGVIRHKWVGSPSTEELDKAIEELVKAAEKSKG